MKVSIELLTQFAVDALQKVGVCARDARITADVLVKTDTLGIHSHGVKNLAGYIRRIRAGGIRVDVSPCVAAEGPAWAVIEGRSTLGMLSATLAMETAIAKAKACGIGYSGIHNGCHAGAVGLYALMAAERDMIGLAMANDAVSMTVPGACKSVLGNNPFAYAAPAGNHPPLFLDVATSSVAGGKVYKAQALGQKIPTNWIVDERGQPTDDPTGFPHTKALLPMAGHKGYGLALMIECLAAGLTGAAVAGSAKSWISSEPHLATEHGGAFVAVDVAAMRPLAEFKEHMDRMIDYLHGAPRAEGCERIYVPGEMEWERRRRALAEGIELPPDVVMAVDGLCKDLGLTIWTPTFDR